MFGDQEPCQALQALVRRLSPSGLVSFASGCGIVAASAHAKDQPTRPGRSRAVLQSRSGLWRPVVLARLAAIASALPAISPADAQLHDKRDSGSRFLRPDQRIQMVSQKKQGLALLGKVVVAVIRGIEAIYLVPDNAPRHFPWHAKFGQLRADGAPEIMQRSTVARFAFLGCP